MRQMRHRLLRFTLLAVGCACSLGLSAPDLTTNSVTLTLPTGAEPVAVAVGDFNSDGRIDFATANYGANSSSVYLNTGSDTFRKSQALAVGSQPTGVASGSFDSGRGVDLVFSVLEGPGYVETYLGQNNGTFVQKTGRATSSEPNTLFAGELDEDKWDDVIVVLPSSNPPTVGLLNNKNDGGFKQPKNKAVKAGPVDASIHQIGGDAYEDVAVVNRDADSVSVYLRLDKDGNSYSSEMVCALAAGSRPTSIALGDLNGDGKADAVVTNSAKNTISVLIGAGNGTFKVRSETPAVGDGPIAVDLADINRDGKLDAAVANRDGGTVSILLGNGDGTFAAQRALTVGAKPSDVRIAPLGKGSSLDLVVTNRGANTVTVILF